jgi:hypothetical protein
VRDGGVALERVVVGGFSQGCIISLLLGLGGRYAGRVGGVVGLSGALCSSETIARAREIAESELKGHSGDGGLEGGRVWRGRGSFWRMGLRIFSSR